MTDQLPVSSLSVVTHNNHPVITTELLARLYGTETNSIKVNHYRNTDRFILGKHYFKLEGSELKDFKNRVTQSYLVDNKVTQSNLVANRAKHLILWTERGAARHAKMLETDQAWEVFEKLEDSYFIQKIQEPVISALPKRFLVSICDGRQSAVPVPDDACVMLVKEMAAKVATGEMYVTSEELYSFITAAVEQLYRRNEYLMNKSA
ncbi:ORF6N domain-containing protein [Limnobaculum parvum]|uniref:ORF6N domain-containing protein n=1 Tax=Limnobaculum parvum TaxID=2172103 RepID=A0A2Y9TTZ0_9GAMM|nr:ORF6N domain-containing protein [Limnobaculum parvum]AWH87158.1 ORF6N domain-containing protein [Limnobaculum parvum]